MTTNATPAKLSDGSWGARTLGNPSIGDVLTITTSSGKSWKAKVVSILRAARSPGDYATVATQSLVPNPGRSDQSLADRGLVRVNSRRGSYIRKMDAQERFDEFDM